MEYGFRSESVAYALPEVRARFIRRTYEHLAYAILGFLVLEYALLNTPGVELIVQYLTYSWLLTLGLFIVAGWIADRWARSTTSRGLQYAGLTLYVVIQAIIFLPLMFIAANYSDATVIPTAAIITGFLFAGLTLVAFTTRADFSFLRTIIFVGAFVALGLIVASYIFGFTLGLIFAVAMVGLAAASILYTTSNIIHYYRAEQYVAASLSLFAAVALMFYYVLWILMSLRR